MVNPKYPEAAERMIRYGGSFVKLIGEAYLRADQSNTRKLESSFEEYFTKYQNWTPGDDPEQDWFRDEIIAAHMAGQAYATDDSQARMDPAHNYFDDRKHYHGE